MSDDSMRDPGLVARVPLSFALDLPHTLGVFRYGPYDPAYAVDSRGIWRAMGTPEGDVTTCSAVERGGVGDGGREYGELVMRAWGPGAEWAERHVEGLHGLLDDPAGFAPTHPVLAELQHRFAGVRFARTDLVLESLVPAILSQKITGQEALASWRQLLRRYGTPAPGPGSDGGSSGAGSGALGSGGGSSSAGRSLAGGDVSGRGAGANAPARGGASSGAARGTAVSQLRVPPSAEVLRSLTDADWHRLGVDRAHRMTLRLVASRAESIERLSARPPEDAAEALQSLRGIGVWTAAEVAERAWGSADHPSFGDYHVASSVGVALVGEPVDDARMAELLEEYRPHRGRVVRLVELGRISRPRRGPRRTIPDFRNM